MDQQDKAPGALHGHLTHLQTIVAILTGLITIAGAAYSLVRSLGPPADTGRIVAVVQEAASGKAVPDATFEILTPRDALVATLKPDSAGRVSYALKEGTYKVRVSHEGHGTVTNEVQVTSGNRVDLTVRLKPGGLPLKEVGHAVKKLFGR